jgi:flagellar basal body-associated protein FliL
VTEKNEPQTPANAKPELVQNASKHAMVAAQAIKKYLGRPGNILLDFPQIFPSLFSTDRPTRRMSFFFFLSLAGLIFVSGYAFQRYWSSKRLIRMMEDQRIARRMKVMEEKDVAEAKRRDSVLNLGSFTLELKAIAHQALRAGVGVGIVNMAEVEIVILCDGTDTRDYIEEHVIQARNQMTNVFTAIDREELLSREGKRRIKGSIIRRLNQWLPRGKVEDLYFSRLSVN